MENRTCAVIHLIKLINAAYTVVAEYKCTPVEMKIDNSSVLLSTLFKWYIEYLALVSHLKIK